MATDQSADARHRRGSPVPGGKADRLWSKALSAAEIEAVLLHTIARPTGVAEWADAHFAS